MLGLFKKKVETINNLVNPGPVVVIRKKLGSAFDRFTGTHIERTMLLLQVEGRTARGKKAIYRENMGVYTIITGASYSYKQMQKQARGEMERIIEKCYQRKEEIELQLLEKMYSCA